MAKELRAYNLNTYRCCWKTPQMSKINICIECISIPQIQLNNLLHDVHQALSRICIRLICYSDTTYFTKNTKQKLEQ